MFFAIQPHNLLLSYCFNTIIHKSKCYEKRVITRSEVWIRWAMTKMSQHVDNLGKISAYFTNMYILNKLRIKVDRHLEVKHCLHSQSPMSVWQWWYAVTVHVVARNSEKTIASPNHINVVQDLFDKSLTFMDVEDN